MSCGVSWSADFPSILATCALCISIAYFDLPYSPSALLLVPYISYGLFPCCSSTASYLWPVLGDSLSAPDCSLTVSASLIPSIVSFLADSTPSFSCTLFCKFVVFDCVSVCVAVVPAVCCIGSYIVASEYISVNVGMF